MRGDLARAALLTLAVAGLPPAAAGAQGIRVHMHGGGGYAADGFLYKPSGQPPFPAILVIPDERGVTQRVIDQAGGWAAAGYVTVAVDLNRGLAAGEAKHSDEQSGHDIDSALTFLASQSTVLKDRVGAFGWGSGGALALRLATDMRVRAVAIEGVAPPPDYALRGDGRAAVLASFGGEEPGVSNQSVKAFDERLRAQGHPVDAKIYPKAGPGFTDSGDAAHFRADDSKDVARREEHFFASELKPSP